MDTNKFFLFATALVLAMALGLFAARAQGTGAIDWQVRGYYSVVGLKSGDTLNVRDKSSPQARIVGELGQGTVIFATGQSHRRKGQSWVQVNHGEGLAWVNGAFLNKQKVLTIGDTRAPVAGSCSGFEPGWEAAWDLNALRASTMSGPIGTASFAQVITPQGTLSPSVIEFTNPAANLRMTLVLQDQQCEALPVDRASYQTGLLMVEDGGSLTAYSGCCNPAPGAVVSAN